MIAAQLHDGSAVDLSIHGSGPTVLMLPLASQGNPPPEAVRLRSALHGALVEALADRYRLVFFDYPGPRAKPRTLTAANVTADLLAVADAADADQFAWCGYSWTAVVGLHLALRTDRLTGLVCGGWPPVGGPYQQMLRVLENRHPATPRPPELEQVITFYRGLADFDDQAAQARMTPPRLCFAGDADDIYDLGIGPTIADHRGVLEELGWDVRILAGLDHMQALEPDVFVPVVASWLDTHLCT